jgi:RNA polymerase sigma-70 factor (ECF subfamily)
VAQETFLDVWRRAPSFDPTRGSATVWVLTIAHRRAGDRVRREDAARRRDERGAALDDSNVTDELADGLERRLDRERVTRALESLTTLQRRAVELAYFDGRTQQEIARLLDVPLGTVKTRIRDGIIRLRDAFEVTP